MPGARIIAKSRVEMPESLEPAFDQILASLQRRMGRRESEDPRADDGGISFRSLQSVSVVGWTVGDGATTVALGLAARAAASVAGDVCLVDAVPASAGGISDLMHVSSRAGLAEVLAETESLENVIFQAGKGGVFIVPVGQRDLREQSADDNRLQRVIGELEDRFRFIFVDLPPLRQGTMTLRWARALSNTVLVASSGRTRRQTLIHSYNTLVGHGARVLGTVLNRRVEAIPDWLYPYL